MLCLCTRRARRAAHPLNRAIFALPCVPPGPAAATAATTTTTYYTTPSRLSPPGPVFVRRQQQRALAPVRAGHHPHCGALGLPTLPGALSQCKGLCPRLCQSRTMHPCRKCCLLSLPTRQILGFVGKMLSSGQDEVGNPSDTDAIARVFASFCGNTGGASARGSLSAWTRLTGQQVSGERAVLRPCRGRLGCGSRARGRGRAACFYENNPTLPVCPAEEQARTKKQQRMAAKLPRPSPPPPCPAPAHYCCYTASGSIAQPAGEQVSASGTTPAVQPRGASSVEPAASGG